MLSSCKGMTMVYLVSYFTGGGFCRFYNLIFPLAYAGTLGYHMGLRWLRNKGAKSLHVLFFLLEKFTVCGFCCI